MHLLTTLKWRVFDCELNLNEYLIANRTSDKFEYNRANVPCRWNTFVNRT
jgi:hypothetical protein